MMARLLGSGHIENVREGFIVVKRYSGWVKPVHGLTPRLKLGCEGSLRTLGLTELAADTFPNKRM